MAMSLTAIIDIKMQGVFAIIVPPLIKTATNFTP